MDIEGAEWGILSDQLTVQCLAKHRAKMLLAVHPGFQRPHRKTLPVISRIFFEIWRLRNYLEAKRLFRTLVPYADLRRTNLNPIPNAKVFASLCLVGYHEFVIDFKMKESK
jgi:hypothetical protein